MLGKIRIKGQGKTAAEPAGRGRASRVPADTKKFYYKEGKFYVENVIIH